MCDVRYGRRVAKWLCVCVCVFAVLNVCHLQVVTLQEERKLEIIIAEVRNKCSNHLEEANKWKQDRKRRERLLQNCAHDNSFVVSSPDGIKTTTHRKIKKKSCEILFCLRTAQSVVTPKAAFVDKAFEQGCNQGQQSQVSWVWAKQGKIAKEWLHYTISCFLSDTGAAAAEQIPFVTFCCVWPPSVCKYVQVWWHFLCAKYVSIPAQYLRNKASAEKL